jgi:hypothetical protein
MTMSTACGEVDARYSLALANLVPILRQKARVGHLAPLRAVKEETPL